MAISVLPFPSALLFVALFALPLHNLARTKAAEAMSDLDYVQWTMYWIIVSLFTFFESAFLWFMVDYCPLWTETKLAAALWLSHPHSLGAAYVWFELLQPVHEKLDDQHYAKFVSSLAVKVPELAKAAREGIADKTDVIRQMLQADVDKEPACAGGVTEKAESGEAAASALAAPTTQDNGHAEKHDDLDAQVEPGLSISKK